MPSDRERHHAFLALRHTSGLRRLLFLDGISPGCSSRIRSGKDFLHSRPQHRQQFGFEPYVSLEPTCVSWTRVGQQDGLGPARPPVTHCLRQGQMSGFRQMPSLCMASDHDGQPHVDKHIESPSAPSRRALDPWRKVARTTSAGIAEPHGQDRDLRRIAKCGLVKAEPIAKPHSRRVVEGPPSKMRPAARRLTGDQHARASADLNNRSGSERKNGTCAAGSDRGTQVADFRSIPFRQKIRHERPQSCCPTDRAGRRQRRLATDRPRARQVRLRRLHLHQGRRHGLS